MAQVEVDSAQVIELVDSLRKVQERLVWVSGLAKGVCHIPELKDAQAAQRGVHQLLLELGDDLECVKRVADALYEAVRTPKEEPPISTRRVGAWVFRGPSSRNERLGRSERHVENRGEIVSNAAKTDVNRMTVASCFASSRKPRSCIRRWDLRASKTLSSGD